MRYPSFLYTIIAFLMMTPSASKAEGILQTFTKGQINWSTGEVSAKGAHVPLKKVEGEISSDEQRHFEKKAVGVAQANLAAILRKLTIHGETTGGHIMGNNSEILAQMELIFLSTPVSSKKFLTDGSVEIALTLPLKGAFSQLILPRDIRQINPIVPLTQPKNEEPPTESGFTGLVVDARGVPLSPALAPRVVTEKGEEVYGPTVISREHAVQNRVATYVPSLAASGKGGFAGENPLVVTGIGTASGSNTDIIISTADAARLHSDPRFTRFLSQCKVVIVMDPLPSKKE